MKWQPFLTLVIVVATVALLIWRSSGKKSGNCGCKCDCAHEPEAPPKKEEALR